MYVNTFELCEEFVGMREEVAGMCEGMNAEWGELWVDEVVAWHGQRAEKRVFDAECDETLSLGMWAALGEEAAG